MSSSLSAVRLQKLLANAGVGSRRQVEQWIRAGRVTVDGRPAQLGERAGTDADIRLDGLKLYLGGPADAATAEALLYYKPMGEVTTRRDPQGRPTVFERLPDPKRGRWIVVGRLDVNTTGLLLFTTDGALAHGLMHPSRQIEREYLVRLQGRPDAAAIERLRQGVMLEDGPAAFDRITRQAAPQAAPSRNAAYRVVLREGRNREVRRLWAAAGYEVSRLLRVRYGPIGLPEDLRPGQWRYLDAKSMAALAAAAQEAGR
jgi:23S rRNA pseudouridine2605 synthase